LILWLERDSIFENETDRRPFAKDLQWFRARKGHGRWGQGHRLFGKNHNVGLTPTDGIKDFVGRGIASNQDRRDGN
jgi:hypothetical protein